MNDAEREMIKEEYINKISDAIETLVQRCGGDAYSSKPVPDELKIRQRELFVHSGISGILSMAVMNRDIETMEFFDWFLGYHISKERNDQRNRDRFTVSMLKVLHDQIIKSCPDNFRAETSSFNILIRLALMALNGTMTLDELIQVQAYTNPMLTRCQVRCAEKEQQEIRKN